MSKVKELLALIDELDKSIPQEVLLNSSEHWVTVVRELIVLKKNIYNTHTTLDELNETIEQNIDTVNTRDHHVGESDYSKNNIQPWDVWVEYSLNPWDADICKRTIRTKTIPGMTPEDARIQDYEKIKHICDERINQIHKGDPWYHGIQCPPWVSVKNTEWNKSSG